MFQRKYNFCGETSDGINVSSDVLYEPKIGYGFVTRENIAKQPRLQIPALMSGFRPIDIVEDWPLPTMFKTDVEKQGNYLVTMSCENDGSEAIIFLERRRLAYVGCFSGKRTFSFAANVCDIIPEQLDGKVYTDTDLDVCWLGTGLKVLKITVTQLDCPTLYIAGDSTVTDQTADFPYSPGVNYCGWGQMISAYLNENVAVSNHAHSGLSTKTFREEGHYAIVEKYIKAGDYFFLQFGHNDQKIEELREDLGYRENITRFVDEVRKKGAFPVIVTPLARNTWKDEASEYNDMLDKYDRECIRLGEELKVPVLKLHQWSKELIVSNGMVASKRFFHPGDYTHTNDYGAYRMAGFVAEEMKSVLFLQEDASYTKFRLFMREGTESWEVDEQRLSMPTLKDASNENKGEEPYQIAMDRLEEILRRK